MALTEAGRELTEEHRIAQLAIGAQGAVNSEALWQLLDPNDIDGSRARWLAASVHAAELTFATSATAASLYVASYQAVEVPGSDRVVLQPRFSKSKVATDLDLAGPQYMKSLIRKGYSPHDAHSHARSRILGLGRKHTMDGGRGLIDRTASNDRRSIGYRRVTGTDPCTFCAMLASRGAVFGSQRQHSVYSSEETALLRASDGKKYHLHCNCTAEIVYGDWVPTPEEQVYVDAYARAAAQADAEKLPRTQENILHLMRADDQAGFRDNLTRRRKTPLVDD